MINLKEYLKLKGMELQRNSDGCIRFFEHHVKNRESDVTRTYHIFTGIDNNSKRCLFIPFLHAWDDVMNKKIKLSDCEVIDKGIKSNDGIPIMFLFSPLKYNGQIDIGISDRPLNSHILFQRGRNTLTLGEYVHKNMLELSGHYLNHKVVDKEGETKTYHVFPANMSNGQRILFIPSLNAWNDVINKRIKLSDCEVVDICVKAKNGMPILFLHRPILCNKLIRYSCNDLCFNYKIFL